MGEPPAFAKGRRQNVSTEIEDETSPSDVAKTPRFSKKKKIIAAACAVLLLGGGAGGIFLSGGKTGESEDPGDGAAEAEGEDNLVEVEPLIVNLRTNDGQARFLKLRILLAAGSPEDVATIEAKLPLIIDSYQPFLRELRPEDLAGSAAVYRIKEELILRAADTVGAGVVANVLIQDMIQQ